MEPPCLEISKAGLHAVTGSQLCCWPCSAQGDRSRQSPGGPSNLFNSFCYPVEIKCSLTFPFFFLVSPCVAGCCCQLHGDSHDTYINFPSTTWVKPDQQQVRQLISYSHAGFDESERSNNKAATHLSTDFSLCTFSISFSQHQRWCTKTSTN